ncbi:hypothetical protein M427DRAFT_318087 [Gonapodya prolifera JEL478]|uniref:FHA domain-containing protein n=1 Tax=Gonapodya prolifera (strain JEL478) TaxID=1344416 RepID=A0A139AXE1_GONPJ|nr:hypothetical protein M427DRAFT_318087 [Gonapodya prolifera JEL478]|eukprot:KXS21379.1 hypothetical protein M427DRAFT_318087 [Gonapodya prolifera JEL478]
MGASTSTTPQTLHPSPFSLIDHGSTHGTFHQGARISGPKAASIPVRLSHMDTIRVGTSIFVVHWHGYGYSASEGCAECCGDNVDVIEPEDPPLRSLRPDGSSRRRVRLDKSRQAFKLAKESSSPAKDTFGQRHKQRLASNYVDRAEMRRQLYPEDAATMKRIEEEKQRLREAVMGTVTDNVRRNDERQPPQRVGLGYVV